MRGEGFFELADIEKSAREGKKGKPVSPVALEAVRHLGICASKWSGRQLHPESLANFTLFLENGGLTDVTALRSCAIR